MFGMLKRYDFALWWWIFCTRKRLLLTKEAQVLNPNLVMGGCTSGKVQTLQLHYSVYASAAGVAQDCRRKAHTLSIGFTTCDVRVHHGYTKTKTIRLFDYTKSTMGRRVGLVLKPESHPEFQDQDQVSWTYKSAGMADWGLKPKVFNSKSTMGRRMGLVSKPETTQH